MLPESGFVARRARDPDSGFQIRVSIRRVLALESQTAFVHGGAEILARQLVAALQESGCEAELVSRVAARAGRRGLVSLYAGARGALHTLRGDYGYVMLEAFLARTPVITTTDAGGPTEFATDGVNARAVAWEGVVERLVAGR